MRISRRSSGGRGEYEISESTQGVTPTDLLNHRLILDFGGGIVVDTNAELRHQGGKFRVRRLANTGIHPHRQVAAVLMMPLTIREDKNWGRGAPVMRTRQYSLDHIQIDRAYVTSADARLKVGDLVLRNASHDAEQLALATRLAQVRALWVDADKFPNNVRTLIERHEALVTSGVAIPTVAERIIAELQEIVTQTREEFGIEYRSLAEDVVPHLLKSLEWAEAPPQQPQPVDDVPPEEVNIRRRAIKDWKQWASYRGVKSAKFRQEVRGAYNSTCLVCGLHLPPTPLNSIAGPRTPKQRFASIQGRATAGCYSRPASRCVQASHSSSPDCSAAGDRPCKCGRARNIHGPRSRCDTSAARYQDTQVSLSDATGTGSRARGGTAAARSPARCSSR